MEKINEMGKLYLNWARPLKSILAVLIKKSLNFNYHHLTSSQITLS